MTTRHECTHDRECLECAVDQQQDQRVWAEFKRDQRDEEA